MKKIISFSLSAAIAMGVSVSAFAADADSLGGIVSTESGRLNIRNSTSSASPVIGTLARNSHITLLSKSGDWWKVEFDENKTGFCHADYIKTVSDNTAFVSTAEGNLNVRSGAGKNHPVIDVIPKGENVIVLSSNGYWSRILYDGTKTGCVSADYLSLNENGYSPVSLSVPDYKQTDSRWKNVTLGSSGKTIGRIGCVTTGIAMIESFRNKTAIYPDAMSKKLSYDRSGNVYWPSDYDVNFWSEDYLHEVYNILRSGKPVLLGAKTAGGSQHWVVVTGFSGGKSLSPSLFSINDPGFSENKNLGQFFASFPYLYKFFSY